MLLLGLNAIRQLGGMAMSDTGEVKFPQRERLMCAAITLDEPDFHAEYDKAKHVWTASWKWSGDQSPVSLKNRLSEYPAPNMAVVIEKFEYRRYMIELENGKRLVRNRRHLRLTTKPKHSNMTTNRISPAMTVNKTPNSNNQTWLKDNHV